MLTDSNIQCALIDFYGKCGEIHVCEEIFDGIRTVEPEKYRSNIYVWNAMISAFAKVGDVKAAQSTFDDMMNETGMLPNRDTLIALISCCAHSGDVAAAKRAWNTYAVNGGCNQYDSFLVSSLIDCYSRNGRIQEALALLRQYEELKTKPDPNEKAMWMSILNACILHKQDKLAATIYDEMKAVFVG